LTKSKDQQKRRGEETTDRLLPQKKKGSVGVPPLPGRRKGKGRGKGKVARAMSEKKEEGSTAHPGCRPGKEKKRAGEKKKKKERKGSV